MICHLSLDLPEQEPSTPLARHLTRALLDGLGVDPRNADDLEHVVGELASNAVRHAGDAIYTLDLEFYPDRAVVTVTDRGRGFPFAAVPATSSLSLPPPGSPRPDEAGGPGAVRFGGWGLPLVEALADRLQFFRTDPHGATVRAEKALLVPVP